MPVDPSRKSIVHSVLALAAVMLLVFAGSTPSPRPSQAAVAAPQIEATSNPLCDCKSCECLDCSCTPLVVGPPPESLIVLASGGELFTEPKLTEPAKAVPIVAKKAAPAGHWEYRQSCGRGGCSMQSVWVADAPQAAPVAQSYGSCGPGGCGVRRGLFGRRR